MNPDWQSFLKSQGATVTEQDTRFSQAPADADCALYDLSHLGLIAVDGEDSDRFLQGQFTNDVREVTAEASQMTGFCNSKGRMLANFLVIRRGDTLLLQLPRGQLPATLKRLGMFVLRSKVKLSDAGNELIQTGVSGDCAPELLARLGLTPPADPWGTATSQGVTAVRLPGPSPRYLLLAPCDPMSRHWVTLANRATVLNHEAWERFNVLAGLPVIYPENAEAFVPQMTNMQLTNGVSFTKGCYTGQEVVARMQYLGKLKRRMYLAHVDTDVSPRPGDEIYAESSTSGQGAGRIVSVSADPAGGYDVLAVMEIESTESGRVHVGEGGPALAIQPLPYTFADDNAAQ